MPLPGELRTLAVDPSETIAWLAVDSHNDLCALVSARFSFPHTELRYGCFDAAGTFVARATIATGFARVQQLTLDHDDNPSMILGNGDPGVEFVIDGRTHSQASCAVRWTDRAIWSECIASPMSITSFAYSDRTGAVAAIIRNEGLNGMIGPVRVAAGAHLASGLPIVESSQLHFFAAGDNVPRFIAPAADRGWWVAGNYSSPTPSAWMLPETSQRRPFWAKVDANFNPVEVHTYAEDAFTQSWSLDAEGRPIALAFNDVNSLISMPISLVGAGFENLVIGRGGYGSAVSASANTVAAMLQFFQGPLEVGAQRFELDPMTQVLATFTRSGELLTARQVPGSWATNLVIPLTGPRSSQSLASRCEVARATVPFALRASARAGRASAISHHSPYDLYMRTPPSGTRRTSRCRRSSPPTARSVSRRIDDVSMLAQD